MANQNFRVKHGLEVNGNALVTGVSTFQGNVNLGDNDSLYFGDGDDLRIYSDGSISRVQADTTPLYLKGTFINLYKGNSSEKLASFNGDGSVELYYANSKKFETTGAGVTITGIATAPTFYAPGGSFNAGSGEKLDASIVIDGDSAIYTKDGTNLRVLIEKQSEIINIGQFNTSLIDAIELKPGDAGSVKLHHGGTTDNLKFETTSSGAKLTGNLEFSTGGINAFTITGFGTNYSVSSNVNSWAAQPMATEIWHDLFAFQSHYTTTYETFNESGWVLGTVNSNLFAQKEDQTITVATGSPTTAVRWTFQGTAWGGAEWLVIGHAWNSGTSNKTILVESGTDGSTWTTRHESTYTNTATSMFHYLGAYNGDSYIRVTITRNGSSTGDVNLSNIKLLTDRPGDQGQGKEYHYPYSWDGQKNITTRNNLTVPYNFNVTGISTFTGTIDANGDLDVDGHTELDTVNISSTATVANLDISGITTATQFHTGAEGFAIRVSSDTISGPATINIDPSGVGDNTGVVVIKGDLQIDGTTTTVNSTVVTVDDKNLLLGSGALNDAAADGGGITLESADGNKTFNWIDSTDSWTSSENLDLASGKVYNINGVEVLSATKLTTTNVSASGIITATTFSGNLIGNVTGNLDGIASQAATLFTSRDFSLTGDVATVASGSFDGSSNVNLVTRLSNSFNANTTGIITATRFISSGLNISGIATINQLHLSGFTPDGSDYGIVNYVPVADGNGTWSWQPIASAGGGSLDGITLLEEGSAVGNAGSIISVNLIGNNITATATGTSATITLNDNPSFGNVSLSGIITASSFVKSGGTSSEFLKADGTVDSSTYLTSYTETDTLNSVTGRGNSTSNGISVGIVTASSFVKSGGTSSEFLKADGTVDSNTYLTTTGSGINLSGIVTSIAAGSGISIDQSTGKVTITATGESVANFANYATTAGIATVAQGLTGNPNIEVGIVTASSFVKSGGTSSQFLKADGTVDSNTYLTSYTETQTLDDVITLGNTSSTGIQVGISTVDNHLSITSSDGSVGRLDLYCEVGNLHYTRLQAAPHSTYSGNATVVVPNTSGTLLLTDGDGSSLTNIVTSISGDSGITVDQSTGDVTISGPDLSSYLTSYTETQTLNDVTSLGNITTNGISVGISTVNNQLSIKSSDGVVGRLDLYCEVGNLHYTRLQAAPHSTYSGNATVVVPNTSGTLLLTDGDGSSLTGIVTSISATNNISVNQSTGSITITGPDLSSYLTSYTETDTLNSVTGRGNSTSNGISVGVLTATSFVKSGGTSSEFLKADGTVDSNTYLTTTGSGINLTGIVTSIAAGSGISIDQSTGKVTITATGGGGGITEIVQDTTPQLGGDLDLNSKSITGTGNISITGIVTATDFNSSSDINLKNNVRLIEDPLSKVMSIRGVNFEWKQNSETSAGVIAQEIEEVMPELVNEVDGRKTVNYNGLIGLLVEVVKDQQKQIDELKEKLS